MAKYRQEKVGKEVLRVLSGALFEEVQDPRLLQVTLTDVSMSADLSIASVRWLCPEGSDKKEIMDALMNAAPFLRSVLGEEIELRRVPTLKFYYDESYENGLKMDALLAKLRANGEMGTDAPEKAAEETGDEAAQLKRLLDKKMD